MMGRSRNRTRATVSNRRLRSTTTTTHFSSTPAIDLNRLAALLSPPSLQNNYSTRRTARVYAPPRTTTPSQPPRAQQRRLRSNTSLSTGVWHQVGSPVRKPSDEHKPDEALVCVSRSERREVLHALRKTGKTGQKSPKFSRASKIHCKK
ncbi:hypothetical protein [Apis mellifera associated microvirus 52]|nr:hypothetical protein [Apis mellifera associated microvirus 52]